MAQVLVDRDGGIATIRISNPAKYNAMTLGMWQTLGDQVRGLAGEEAIRVLLIRGEGEKAFVSGADIAEFEKTRSAETGSEVYDQAVDEAQQALMDCDFPVVAGIHGVCMGGGLGLAMACDLRYAAADARFRMPAARLGLGYGYRGIRRMVGQLGAPRVADLFFTARTFDGVEAQRLGLVNETFAAGQLDKELSRILAMIAQNAPLTLKLAKRAILLSESGPAGGSGGGRNGSGAGGGADARASEIATLESLRKQCIQSADYAEGRRAFAEKRPPKFTGR